MGICTNKPVDLAETLMTRLGVRGAFGALVGANSLPVRKPDPAPLFETVRRLGGDPARTCLVGDSDTDRRTAANAGVRRSLTFGPGGGDMAALQPEALIGISTNCRRWWRRWTFDRRMTKGTGTGHGVDRTGARA